MMNSTTNTRQKDKKEGLNIQSQQQKDSENAVENGIPSSGIEPNRSPSKGKSPESTRTSLEEKKLSKFDAKENGLTILVPTSSPAGEKTLTNNGNEEDKNQLAHAESSSFPGLSRKEREQLEPAANQPNLLPGAVRVRGVEWDGNDQDDDGDDNADSKTMNNLETICVSARVVDEEAELKMKSRIEQVEEKLNTITEANTSATDEQSTNSNRVVRRKSVMIGSCILLTILVAAISAIVLSVTSNDNKGSQPTSEPTSQSIREPPLIDIYAYQWIARSTAGFEDAMIGQSLKYGDKVFFQDNSVDDMWLTGWDQNRENEGVYTGDMVYNVTDYYKWILRSRVGDGDRDYKRDPMIGQCVKYGDEIFLQNNFMDNAWLTGGRGGGNQGVVIRDMFGSGYESDNPQNYKWIVRSTAGNGYVNYEDPMSGECWEYGDKVFLQITARDDRWLRNCFDRCNNRRVFSSNFYIHAYQWTARSTAGFEDAMIGQSLKYGDKVFFQVNNVDDMWLTGWDQNRENEGVYTGDMVYNVTDYYKWILRSRVGDGDRDYKRDPMIGQCVKYGDEIFLQNNFMDNAWLTGGRGGGNQGVVIRDMFGSGYESDNPQNYKWIVRSTRSAPGNEGLMKGGCLEYGDKVFLQTTTTDDRWLQNGDNRRVYSTDISQVE